MQNLNKDGSCRFCGRYDNRGITVDAVIIKDSKILLIKRGAQPFRGYWSLPGGYIEFDESAEDTIKREVKEETGLSITSLKLIGAYSDPRRAPKQVIDLAYFASAKGTLSPGDDADDVKWFSLKDLPELPFDHEKIITDSLNLLG